MKDTEKQTRKTHAPSSRGEFDFINTLRQQAESSSISHLSSVVSGIGDDAAVIRTTAGKDTVITTDLLVEDIDFRRDSISARFLGHKALAVSFSDIAAMGARPRWALLSVGVPEEVWKTEFLERLYDGLFELALRYDVKLVGGDTSRTTEKIVIDSIVMGESAAGLAVLRSGAQPGDQIFVTGS